jgi:hypothetical protein
MRKLLTFIAVLTLSSFVLGEEPAWKYPQTFVFESVEVNLLNWEITRDRKAVLVHAKLRSQAAEPIYFHWQDLITLENTKGQKYGPNYDALVDRNGAGLTRTVNEFRLAPREKARITIPFEVTEVEFPLRLVLPDGRKSILIP